MAETLRLLQVEDSESDAALVVRLLRKAGYDVHSKRVDGPGDMRAALDTEAWDVIIADHRMGQFDAPGALKILHETGRDIPFIVASGSIGEELAVTMMKSGAHDYVLKNNLARLAPAVDREIREARTRRERIEAEKKLRDSEERLALAVQATQLGTFDYLPQTGNMIWSDLTRRHFGLSPGAPISFDIALCAVHPEDRESAARKVLELLRPGSDGHWAAEFRTIGREDRAARWISSWGRAFFDAQGRPVRFVGVTLDVTERRSLEEQFRRTQQRLRHVVASSPAVLFTMGITGNEIHGVSWISDNVKEVLGYPPEVTIGAAWWMDGTHPDDLAMVRARAAADLLGRGYMECEFRFRHADGTYRWTRCEIRRIHDETGLRSEGVGAWSDITGRKVAEEEQARLREQLQQAQKLESVGRLAGGIAHDFNNLLTVINGYSSMLLKQAPPGDGIHEGLAEIQLAGERAAALSRQLLMLSRKSVVQTRNVNLNDIVAEVEKMLERVIGEDIRVECLLDPALGYVLADPGRWNQVLMNLAVNARDAMPRGGTLRIETANLDPAGSDQRRQVQLKVSDTGVGMTQEVLSHLFEPFFTTKKPGEGTGLGLATVYGIVQQCGGSIQVHSEPGNGATFTIRLPGIDAPGAQEAQGDTRSIARGTETILVVEDQEQLRTLAVRVLRKYGYRVLEAAGPAEALACSAGCHDDIHLVLTDIVMPEMSGIDLAGQLLQMRPDLKIAFMSGYSEKVNAESHRLEVADAYLAKPFSPEALAATVRAVLDRPR
ncbi:MAG: response regulator [Candidatus Sulfopaludibacter sp.]|nr:response regulator [Candidatus Sulfopaludibacter sp.]